jgi:hypothetical protein
MILGAYATLGVFLMIASLDPMAHKSLIWFTVWSSFVHGAIMAVQSIADTRHIGHLWGDAAPLIVVGAVLAALHPLISLWSVNGRTAINGSKKRLVFTVTGSPSIR